nr:MAG TPA: hypothetical protein [Caudoviricetes sp.]
MVIHSIVRSGLASAPNGIGSYVRDECIGTSGCPSKF